MLKLFYKVCSILSVFFVMLVAVSTAWVNTIFVMLNWNWLSLFERLNHSLAAVASLMLIGVFVAWLDTPKVVAKKVKKSKPKKTKSKSKK
jgi:hypothetical protein